MGERCLVCGARPVQDAHWPRAVGMGRDRRTVEDLPTVPLCTRCHTAQHAGDRQVIEALTREAPRYWRRIGMWEAYREVYETWMARRALIGD